jgi:UDP-N-acetylmuramyl tripeptide synthase
MLAGVVAAFVLAAGNNGKLDADYACIEIDEASTLRVFPHFQPDYMVLTNLFRDQLDRYGEIDITMDMLERAMKMAPNMTVIVNGDDALSAYLAMKSGNPYRTYGITERVFDNENSNEIREGRFCKKCGAQLQYEFYHYSQIGKYDCPNCDFTRPEIDFEASHIDMKDGLQFDVEGRHIAASYRGFYNIYNILAAYSAARTAGMELAGFGKVLQEFNPQNGRMEEFSVGGTHVILNLAKNPAGFNQNISAVMEDEKEKDIIIVINDNAQDGTDISWLWDVDFDRFAEDRIRSVTVSGIRCQDMRLRMKYVDIHSELIADVRTAIEARVKDGCKNLYVLVNYTALFSTRNILAAMADKDSQSKNQ